MKFSDDFDYLNRLQTLLKELSERNNLAEDESVIYERLRYLFELSQGAKPLKMEQKLYGNTVRWLDDLGDISRSELGDDFVAFHNYFAYYYKIPKK
jgi:hypothetical protein